MSGSVWAERLRPPTFGFWRVALALLAAYAVWTLFGAEYSPAPILVFGYWRGEFWTAWIGRSLASWWRNRRVERAESRPSRSENEPDLPPVEDPEAATVVLRIARGDHEVSAVDPSRTSVTSRDRIPLEVVFGYLDRYGVRAERVSVVARSVQPEQSLSRDYYSRLVPPSALASRTTWLSLTFTAAGCERALKARFASVSANGLNSLATATATRLAAQLRGLGWCASVVPEGEVSAASPPALGRSQWTGVRDRRGGWWSAHAVDPRRCSTALAASEAAGVAESWMSLSAAPGGAASAWLAVRSAQPSWDRLFPGSRPLSGRHAAAISSLAHAARRDLPGVSPLGVALGDAAAALEWPSGQYGAPVGVTTRGSVALASLAGFSGAASVGIFGEDPFVSQMTARALLTVRSAVVLSERPDRWRRVSAASGGILRVNDPTSAAEMLVLDGMEAPPDYDPRLVVTVGPKIVSRHDVLMIQNEQDPGRFELRTGGNSFDLTVNLGVRH